MVTAAAASASSVVVKTTYPKTRKSSSTTKRQPTFATVDAAVQTRPSCPVKKKQSAVAKIEPGGAKRAKLGKTLDFMPVASSTMTASQLIDEMKARGHPYAKGMAKGPLSGKSKEFLLSCLGIGTKLHSSAVKQDVKAQHLHIY